VLVTIALSYIWGSAGKEASEQGVTAERCEQLICEDGIIHITRNLLDFLRDVRQYHCDFLEKLFWTGAVCIDQNNLNERAAQVQMMDSVYMQAQSVVVWLGRAEQTTPQALEIMAVIENADLPTLNPRIDRLQPLNRFLGSLADSGIHWNVLEPMMQGTWFSRTWVLQEFLFWYPLFDTVWPA
jgi:hypothetical protein